jgi:hypothetical protein
LADLDVAFETVEQEVSEGEQAAGDYAKRLQADDRSKIAKVIVYAFILSILFMLGVTAFIPWEMWKDPADFLLKLLSSVMLPVVTLVIGYYFGREK